MSVSAVKTKNMIRARNLKNTWRAPCVVITVSLAHFDNICRKKLSFGDHPNIWRDLTISHEVRQSTNGYAAHRQCARDANSLSSNDGMSWSLIVGQYFIHPSLPDIDQS